MMNRLVLTSMILYLGSGTIAIGQEIGPELIRSEVISKAFAVSLAEMMIQKAKGGLPREATKPEFVVRVARQLEEQFPNIFQVTKQEEADFEAGTFDDDANSIRMKESVQELSDWGAELPTLSVMLIEKLNAKNLQGAQLEFAARLLAAQVESAKSEVDRNE